MNIEETQDAITEEFSLLEGDREMAVFYLMELGQKLPEMPETDKTEENVVKGCQSKVWLHSLRNGDKIQYEADSNTVITKGIIALLVRVLSNQKAEDILNSNLEFIDRIDLKSHLSSQRTAGLGAMIKYMKAYAAQKSA